MSAQMSPAFCKTHVCKPLCRQARDKIRLQQPMLLSGSVSHLNKKAINHKQFVIYCMPCLACAGCHSGARDRLYARTQHTSRNSQHSVTTSQSFSASCSSGANNYLGLSNHPLLADAAINAIRTHGYGLSSVRFICGTQVCSVQSHSTSDCQASYHGNQRGGACTITEAATLLKFL